MKEGVDEAKQKMRENYYRMSEKVNEKAAEIKDKTNKYVVENPEKSLLMAAGVGALIAFFLMGARRRRY